MLVTVIIPLYNKRRWVGRAIESVLGQSHADWELIVVDDGSSDGSAEVAAAFRDPRMRVVRQDNQGVSAARNRGVQEATADWVAFLDADDWWEPSFLKQCLEMQQSHEGVLYGSNVHLGTDGRTAFSEEGASPWIIEDFSLAAVGCDYPPVPNSSCMVQKAALLRAGGFPVGVVLGEDTDTWLRLSFEGDLVLSRAPLVHYDMSDEESAVRRLRIPASRSHPPSINTCRLMKAALAPSRRLSLQHYAQFLIRKEIDVCVCTQNLRGIWQVLCHHGDIGGADALGHAVKVVIVQLFSRLRVRLALGSRLQRLWAVQQLKN